MEGARVAAPTGAGRTDRGRPLTEDRARKQHPGSIGGSETGVYVVMLSLHGLVRGTEPELGRDADTGGQVLYVLELARALGRHPNVERVDLVTRRVVDPKVGDDYAAEEERLGPGARLVRVDFGPRRYLRKEVLWRYLDVCVDRVLQHVRRVGRVPDVIHGHYADAGLAGARVAGLLGVPFVFTGHSLGREKRRRLLAAGATRERLESVYRIGERIEAEERALDAAAAVVASTRQEVESQYGMYGNHDPRRMVVIPPGVDLEKFRPPRPGEPEPPIAAEIDRFLERPRRPAVLALARPDERKNLHGLLVAYGRSAELQRRANLVLMVGNRDDVSELDREPREIYTGLLLDIDRYDLYGRVAYPKHHGRAEVPALYRLATRRRGVFVNPALTEPFGLTLIEAAASGLPVVATDDGGPRDIVSNLGNGALVDPLDSDAIGAALLGVVGDVSRWRKLSGSGLRNVHRHYTWEGHVDRYLEVVRRVRGRRRTARRQRTVRLPTADRFLVCEIDEALVGERRSLDRLEARLRESDAPLALIAVSGRSLEGARAELRRWKAPAPDALVTSAGCEIHTSVAGGRLIRDELWSRHIDFQWNPDPIRAVLSGVPGLSLQDDAEQGRFKISYLVDPAVAPRERKIRRILRREGLRAGLLLSHGMFLDVVPIRASKGQALRWLAMRWGLPMERFLVAGAAGADLDMLAGDTLGVVVAGADRRLRRLEGSPRVYFADRACAAGVLEGIEHYRFLEAEVDPARLGADGGRPTDRGEEVVRAGAP